jgi:hypothetical protein
MILVGPNFKKMYFVSLLNFKTDFFQSYINCLVKHNSPIL